MIRFAPPCPILRSTLAALVMPALALGAAGSEGPSTDPTQPGVETGDLSDVDLTVVPDCLDDRPDIDTLIALYDDESVYFHCSQELYMGGVQRILDVGATCHDPTLTSTREMGCVFEGDYWYVSDDDLGVGQLLIDVVGKLDACDDDAAFRGTFDSWCGEGS